MSLEEIINNNSNLEDYFMEFNTNPEFLVHYYNQDLTRIQKNYNEYSKYLSTKDKISIIYNLLNSNADAKEVDTVFYDTLLYKEKEDEEVLTELSNYILEKEKRKEFDTSSLRYEVSNYINKKDPVYFIKKDINNINNLPKITDSKTVLELLEYCRLNDYYFTKDNEFFIRNSVFESPETINYFLKNFKYDDEVLTIIESKLKNIEDKKFLLDLSNKMDIGRIKTDILRKLNIDNFDISTINKDNNIYFNTKGNHEKIIEMLNDLKKEHYDKDVVLIMDRVDLEFIDQVKDVYDNIRISPLNGQQEKEQSGKYIWAYPDYDIEHIKKCERILNMYADSVNDTLDIDGELKSLSPLEKYIAAYLITIKSGVYKQEDPKDDNSLSRGIYEFVANDDDKRIVCVGYVNLLKDILYRMGIKDTADWSIYAPSEGAKHNHSTSFLDINHRRLLIHLKDPKYNIDGVYMADPTWDSADLVSSQFRHLLMTKEEIFEVDKELRPEYIHFERLDYLNEELNEKDIGLSFHNAIPKSTIVKAFLAVNRFLDRNMKMAKSDDDYSKIEYDEMAKRLGFETFPEISIEESMDLKVGDILHAREVYGTVFTYDLSSEFKALAKENNITTPVLIDKKGFCLKLDEESLKEMVNSGYDIDLERKKLYLYSFNKDEYLDDKKVSEFFELMIDKINEFKQLTDDNDVKIGSR